MATAQCSTATTTDRTARKPTGRQVYKIAALLIEAAELTWPDTVADASALIQGLSAQTATVATDDIPL